MTLDGLEDRALSAIPPPHPRGPRTKVHVIRYADDLVVTARTREILDELVTPAIAAFLEERGLKLSQEKTKTVHIDEGFDFLGANIRKYDGKLKRRPAKARIRELIRKTRDLMRRYRASKTEVMLGQLNRILRGWAHQFRHLAASKAFGYIDHCIFRQLWRWARKRHNKKGARWVKQRYFTILGNDRWVFHARPSGKGPIVLFHMSSLPIRWHIKVRSATRYHDARYAEYFKERWLQRRRRRYQGSRQGDRHQQLKLPLYAQDTELPGRCQGGLRNA
jgi:RNA-directed DNA polymerase